MGPIKNKMNAISAIMIVPVEERHELMILRELDEHHLVWRTCASCSLGAVREVWYGDRAIFFADTCL